MLAKDCHPYTKPTRNKQSTFPKETKYKVKISPQPKKETGKVRDTEKEKKTHSKEKLAI